MKTKWGEILDQIKLISTDIYSSVNDPADSSEINRLQETIGAELPTAFRDYLSTMNGQQNTEEATRNRDTEIPLLGLNPFLSITGIIETWNRMNDLFADETEPLEWVQEDKIKPFIWRRHWIPFTEFEVNEYLILDCEPGKNGTYGQVFIWDSGMDYSEVIAASFGEFSDEVLSRLSKKKFKIGEFGTIDFEDYFI